VGLACALHLHAAGVPVRVFEAADDVGGRVRTDVGRLPDRSRLPGADHVLSRGPAHARPAALALGRFVPARWCASRAASRASSTRCGGRASGSARSARARGPGADRAGAARVRGCAADPAARKAIFERACALAEESLARLKGRTGDLAGASDEALRAHLAAAGVSARDAAGIQFWSAVVWGAWSQTHGLLDAARKGVANRVHLHAELAHRIDPALEEGGPLRLLSRLHGTLPRVARRDAALERLEQVAASDLRASHAVEDEAVRRAASERLERERAASG
jgi:hypothetical protein